MFYIHIYISDVYIYIDIEREREKEITDVYIYIYILYYIILYYIILYYTILYYIILYFIICYYIILYYIILFYFIIYIYHIYYTCISITYIYNIHLDTSYFIGEGPTTHVHFLVAEHHPSSFIQAPTPHATKAVRYGLGNIGRAPQRDWNYGFVWKCWVYIPNEIAICYRDNDQQNHWV